MSPLSSSLLLLARAGDGTGRGTAPGNDSTGDSGFTIDPNIAIPVALIGVLFVAILAGTLFIRSLKAKGEKISAYS